MRQQLDVAIQSLQEALQSNRLSDYSASRIQIALRYLLQEQLEDDQRKRWKKSLDSSV